MCQWTIKGQTQPWDHQLCLSVCTYIVAMLYGHNTPFLYAILFFHAFFKWTLLLWKACMCWWCNCAQTKWVVPHYTYMYTYRERDAWEITTVHAASPSHCHFQQNICCGVYTKASYMCAVVLTHMHTQSYVCIYINVPCCSGSLVSVMKGRGGSIPSKLTLCSKDCGLNISVNFIRIINDGITVLGPVYSSTNCFWIWETKQLIISHSTGLQSLDTKLYCYHN